MASAKEIPPGGEGHIRVTIGKVLDGGPIRKSAWVNSNDKTKPRTKLSLRAEIRTALGADPKFLDFGKRRLGVTISSNVKLIGFAREKIKISRVICNDPNLEVTLDQGALKVTLLGRKIGKIDVPVKLDTDFADQRFISVLRISGQVLGAITVNPSFIEVPRLAEGETFEKILTIASESDTFKITGVSTSKQGPRFSVETVKAGLNYHIHLKILANQPQNYLYITTDHALQPKLKVMLLGQ